MSIYFSCGEEGDLQLLSDLREEACRWMEEKHVGEGGVKDGEEGDVGEEMITSTNPDSLKLNN